MFNQSKVIQCFTTPVSFLTHISTNFFLIYEVTFSLLIPLHSSCENNIKDKWRQHTASLGVCVISRRLWLASTVFDRTFDMYFFSLICSICGLWNKARSEGIFANWRKKWSARILWICFQVQVSIRFSCISQVRRMYPKSSYKMCLL